MKNRIKDYFYFTRIERNGLIALIIIITALPLSMNLLKFTQDDHQEYDSILMVDADKFLSESKDQLSDYEEIKGHESYSFNQYGSINKQGKGTQFKPFEFNPNTASFEDYCRMGFSQKQAASIIKYLNKGGYFKIKEDFTRLYVVSEETYRVLEPFITLPSSKEVQQERHDSLAVFEGGKNYKKSDYVNDKHFYKLVELNSADSLELLDVRGIGPVFASRILSYRKKLGGFITTGQLLEVYGIDSLRYNGIVNQIGVDTLKVDKISLNTISLNELRRHPYLNYYSAKAIIDKRIQSGGYTSVDEIRGLFKGREDAFKKIRPYLQL